MNRKTTEQLVEKQVEFGRIGHARRWAEGVLPERVHAVAREYLREVLRHNQVPDAHAIGVRAVDFVLAIDVEILDALDRMRQPR